MKALIFEGAGWDKESASSDVGNCRIRTRIRNNEGTMIYLEINGFESTKYTKREFPITGYVMHCFSQDCNEDSPWRKHERARIEYTAAGLLRWVNDHLSCSFDALQVVNDGLAVHDTKEPLCESRNDEVMAL